MAVVNLKVAVSVFALVTFLCAPCVDALPARLTSLRLGLAQHSAGQLSAQTSLAAVPDTHFTPRSGTDAAGVAFWAAGNAQNVGPADNVWMLAGERQTRFDCEVIGLSTACSVLDAMARTSSSTASDSAQSADDSAMAKHMLPAPPPPGSAMKELTPDSGVISPTPELQTTMIASAAPANLGIPSTLASASTPSALVAPPVPLVSAPPVASQMAPGVTQVMQTPVASTPAVASQAPVAVPTPSQVPVVPAAPIVPSAVPLAPTAPQLLPVQTPVFEPHFAAPVPASAQSIPVVPQGAVAATAATTPVEAPPQSATKTCPAPGHAIFLHVMKTAGLSVDDFLECEGTAAGWSILHHDGQEERLLGESSCKPSVCTLHGSLSAASSPENCGPSFAKAATFTILRDPADRIWSFYHYLRAKYVPYQQKTLAEILENLGHEDLNQLIEPKDRCSFCHTQLSNPMVLYNFVGEETQVAKKSCDGPLCAPSRSMLTKALEESKVVLANMHAVYLMEDMPNFVGSFLSDPKLSPVPGSSGKHCELPHTNPSNYGSHAALDNTMRKLIEATNWADVALYEYAKQLPNRMRSTVSGR